MGKVFRKPRLRRRAGVPEPDTAAAKQYPGGIVLWQDWVDDLQRKKDRRERLKREKAALKALKPHE